MQRIPPRNDAPAFRVIDFAVAAQSRGGGDVPVDMEWSAPSPRRTKVLGAGLVGILLWQGLLFLRPEESRYPLKASGGILPWQRDFVYFLYYLNLYPVATEAPPPRELSKEGARRLLETQGGSLVMDRFWTIRYGELGKTYLYLPHSWLQGRPGYQMKYANGPPFVLALVALFTGFWWLGFARLGLILVVLVGSNPFQVSEVYANSNVFGWPITITVLVLALHLPLLGERRPSATYYWSLPVVTGLILATIRQVRSEPVLVIASAALAYLFASPLRARVRVALVTLLATSFILTSRGWTFYFDGKFRQAHEVVRVAGGHPYNGPRSAHHFFWHALWCGLGDFDQKYGHQWSDREAAEQVLPILASRHGSPTGYSPVKTKRYDWLTMGVYWDRARKYARTPFETPEYVQVIREQIMHEVTTDPAWYLTILGKRVLRIMTQTTAPSLHLGRGFVLSPPDLPVYGLLALLVVYLLIRARQWLLLKVIIFTLPLAGTALVVYSGGGTPYYNVYHLVAFGIGLEWLVAGWQLRRSPARNDGMTKAGLTPAAPPP
jgi:hypothetical protein